MDNRSIFGKWVVAILAIAGVILALVNLFIDNMPKGEVQKVKEYVPWEKETIEMAESIPVQDGGRIKPFSTYAGFRMLALHGARSMKVEGKGGEVFKLKPTAWLMDTVYRPWFAVQMPTFRIDNSKVLEAIGVKQKGRRDRYSYNEIATGREKLIELAKSYEGIEKEKRDPVHQQTIDLAYNLRSYEALLGYFAFARTGLTLTGTAPAGGKDQTVSFSTVMSSAPSLRFELSRMMKQEGIDGRLQDLLQQILDGANMSKYGLFLLPPQDKDKTEWLSAGNAIMSVMSEDNSDPSTTISDIALMEGVVMASFGKESDFRESLKTFKDKINDRAEARGEGKLIGLEVNYFKRDFFLNALVFFLIGSVLTLAMWGLGSTSLSKWINWTIGASTTVGVFLCVVAITMRCVIMQRPPVGNLYDTVIFIGATSVILALVVEWMTRKRFALGLSPIIGAALILLARRYEMGDAGDHLDPLVAVLDSNYWLTTHVITITLGYSAGLLSAVLSCAYVLMRGLNLDGDDKDLRRSLTKAVYGCICLTVFLSLVGTVLGGVWANDSWGRFWGWDPKENGALMIVLWTLAILHARLGGIIKDWGLHLCSIFTACIVAFSWWHVNFFGVGLHNYGFTAGKFTIFIFYGVMMFFILCGIMMMWLEREFSSQKNRQANLNGLVPEAQKSH